MSPTRIIAGGRPCYYMSSFSPRDRARLERAFRSGNGALQAASGPVRQGTQRRSFSVIRQICIHLADLTNPGLKLTDSIPCRIEFFIIGDYAASPPVP